MSIASLEAAIPRDSRVLLDSTTLIAYLNGREVASALAEHVLDQLVERGRNEAVVSMVTVLEVLVRPLQKSPADYNHAMDFITRFPHLKAQPIDLGVAQEAASVRATQGLKTPDAIVVATAVVTQVGQLVTNDKRWKGVKDSRIKIVYLGDHL